MGVATSLDAQGAAWSVGPTGPTGPTGPEVVGNPIFWDDLTDAHKTELLDLLAQGGISSIPGPTGPTGPAGPAGEGGGGMSWDGMNETQKDAIAQDILARHKLDCSPGTSCGLDAGVESIAANAQRFCLKNGAFDQICTLRSADGAAAGDNVFHGGANVFKSNVDLDGNSVSNVNVLYADEIQSNTPSPNNRIFSNSFVHMQGNFLEDVGNVWSNNPNFCLTTVDDAGGAYDNVCYNRAADGARTAAHSGDQTFHDHVHVEGGISSNTVRVDHSELSTGTDGGRNVLKFGVGGYGDRFTVSDWGSAKAVNYETFGNSGVDAQGNAFDWGSGYLVPSGELRGYDNGYMTLGQSGGGSIEFTTDKTAINLNAANSIRLNANTTVSGVVLATDFTTTGSSGRFVLPSGELRGSTDGYVTLMQANKPNKINFEESGKMTIDSNQVTVNSPMNVKQNLSTDADLTVNNNMFVKGVQNIEGSYLKLDSNVWRIRSDGSYLLFEKYECDNNLKMMTCGYNTIMKLDANVGNATYKQWVTDRPEKTEFILRDPWGIPMRIHMCGEGNQGKMCIQAMDGYNAGRWKHIHTDANWT